MRGVLPGEKKTPPERVFDADELVCLSGVDLPAFVARCASTGRRSHHTSGPGRSGRVAGARPFRRREPIGDLALVATLRAAAARLATSTAGRQTHGRNAVGWTAGSSSAPGAPLRMESEDWRRHVRKRAQSGLIVFVVDASESMGAQARMEAAKGAALALLAGAYLRRDRVAVVAFGGERARVLLPPTTSTSLARHKLRRLPVGGATPFADGLHRAWGVVRSERLKDPDVVPLLVVISDGEANVPLDAGRDAWGDLWAMARAIRHDRVVSIVIDTQPRPGQSTQMRRLADALQADYHHIDTLRADALVEVVRAAG